MERCAYRLNNSKAQLGGMLGFRLNGVMRGSSFGSYVDRYRSGSRWGYYARSYVYRNLGFRCEWCSSRWGI